MDILKINQYVKIVPDNVSKISSGVIAEINSDCFSVKHDIDNKYSAGMKADILVTNGDYLIKFTATLDKAKNNLLYFLIPKEYKIIQRREYPRISTSIPVTCREAGNSDNNFSSVITNLSGGGMQIISPKMINQGILLEAGFKISNKRKIYATIEVLRSAKSGNEQEKFFLAGIFKKIPNIDRISIIQFCFKRRIEVKCRTEAASCLEP